MRSPVFNTTDIGNGSSNLIGPLGLGSGCGPQPIYAVHNRKEKMAAWNKCMEQARILEQQKKQAKVDEKTSNNAVNNALANATTQGGGNSADNSSARTEGTKQPGLSMLTWGLIGIGSLAFLGLGAYLIFKK